MEKKMQEMSQELIAERAGNKRYGGMLIQHTHHSKLFPYTKAVISRHYCSRSSVFMPL